MPPVLEGPVMPADTLGQPLYGVLIFVVGFTTGYVTSAYIKSADDATARRTIAFLITFVWLLTVFASIGVPEYETPLAVHGVMGAVVGYLFARESGLKADLGRDISVSYGGNNRRETQQERREQEEKQNENRGNE